MAGEQPGSQSHWARLRIGGWGLRLFPPEMSRNLQVPWWKSGVTSHSKNWQIWCSPWGGDALQYLMQLVATPDTDCYFWFWPPFVQGHVIPFMLVTCLWNLFSLCLSCWILLCSYKYLHMLSLLKINTVDSERMFLFSLSLCEKILWIDFVCTVQYNCFLDTVNDIYHL